MGNGSQQAAAGENISSNGAAAPAPAAMGAAEEEAGEAEAAAGGGVGPAGGPPVNSRREAFAQVCLYLVYEGTFRRRILSPPVWCRRTHGYRCRRRVVVRRALECAALGRFPRVHTYCSWSFFVPLVLEYYFFLLFFISSWDI